MVGDGLSALRRLVQNPPDLIMLDVVLPHLDGLEVCRQVREQSQVPIIIISGQDNRETRVEGLDAGADDYITKPVDIEEMLSRVRAVMRRSTWSTEIASEYAKPVSLEPGGLRVEVSPVTRTVLRNGEPLQLSPVEFRLLTFLVMHPDRVLTHGAILRGVWGEAYLHETHMLHVNVSRLRRKIEPDPSHPTIITTIPGVGYTVPSR